MRSVFIFGILITVGSIFYVTRPRTTNTNYNYQKHCYKVITPKWHGAGVSLGKNRILTANHLASHTMYLQDIENKIQRGKVLYINREHDAAILMAVTDTTPEFDYGRPKPNSRAHVFGIRNHKKEWVPIVIGYPTLVTMNDGVTRLCYQLSGNVTYGFSGGAVFYNGRLLGIMICVSTTKNNVGYMIPLSHIKDWVENALQ